MTDFLRVNQIPASVLIADASFDPSVFIGADSRAEDGTMRTERRARKRTWSYRLAHMSSANALAWIDLLSGAGHHWSFDSSLYGSKGYAPVGAAGTLSSTHKKFGAQALKVTSGNSVTITGTLKGTAAGYGWCVGYWLYNGASFDQWLEDSSGAQYVNGALQGTPHAHRWLTVASSGVITLAGVDSGNAPSGNRDNWFDDLFCLDLNGGAAAGVPTSWATALAAATSAFSDLGMLQLDGLGIENNGRVVTAIAKVGSVSVMPASLDGTFQNVQTFPVTFEEV